MTGMMREWGAQVILLCASLGGNTHSRARTQGGAAHILPWGGGALALCNAEPSHPFSEADMCPRRTTVVDELVAGAPAWHTQQC